MRKREFEVGIQYQNLIDFNFANEIAATTGGEQLFSCIQCGNCSGVCPMSIYMDYTPRQIIAMTRAGFKDDVLHSSTIWQCASCYACTVECPKQIKITDIMYSLKQRAIQKGLFPKRFPVAVLAKEFYESVKESGRNSEGRLILRLYAKTRPFKLLRQAWLGLRLFLTGRLSLQSESIRGKRELKAMLCAIEDGKGGSR